LAVVRVPVADHALTPAAFELCSCTSIAAPAARPDNSYGLVTPDTVVQLAAPAGLHQRANPVAAPCVLSITGAAQVTLRSLPVPCANVGALGAFGGIGGGAVTVADEDGGLARLFVE
jgi:hypothetical protein